MRLWVPALAGALGAACSIPDLEDVESKRTQNECTSDDDCGSAARCGAGICQAGLSVFDSVLLSVTPSSSDSGPASGTRMLVPWSGLVRPTTLDVAMEVPTKLKVVVKAPAPTDGTCEYEAAPDGSLPASVTFTPTVTPLGLSTKNYQATTVLVQGSSGDFTNELRLSLPAGEYDVYVQPTAPTSEEACPVVPQIVRSHRVEPTKDTVALTLPAAVPATLDVTIRWLPGDTSEGAPSQTLQDWTAEMIDPVSGRIVSTRETLLAATPSSLHGGEVEYALRLSYWQDAGAYMGQELLRLSPPDGVTAPTMVWSREGLEVLTAGQATLDLRTLPSEVVVVEGLVATSGGEPVPAAVTVSSLEVASLDAGLLASFTVPAEAGADGKFVVNLLPGKYRVVAEPDPLTGLPASSAEWDVAATSAFQAGRVVELADPGSIAGDVVVAMPGSPPLAGASVHAFSSPSRSASNAFKTQIGAPPYVPRASNGITSESGSFDLGADPGTFDLSVRPANETGFAWLVRPRVTVPNAGLGTLRLPLPVVHSGVLTMDGQPVVNARVGVYVFVGGASEGYVTAPEKADGVLQVAESVTGADGAFRILLPSALN